VKELLRSVSNTQNNHRNKKGARFLKHSVDMSPSPLFFGQTLHFFGQKPEAKNEKKIFLKIFIKRKNGIHSMQRNEERSNAIIRK